MRHILAIHTLLAGFFLGFLATRSSATTYYVDINSPNPTPPYANWSTASKDIQSAVNQTTNGDLVLVNPGVYGSVGYTTPDGAATAVVVTNAISLLSANGAAMTSINGSNTMRCVALLAGGAMLNGFTLTNGNNDIRHLGTENGGGVLCAATNDLVFNCLLINSYGATGGGAFYGLLSNCTITANSALNGGGAAGSVLENCVVSNNGVAFAGGGAYVCELTNCLLISNGAQSDGAAAGCTINNCTVVQNSASVNDGGIDGSSTAYNSIIYYNSSPGLGQNFDPASILTNCCTVPAPTGIGNITDPPLFVNLTNNFHLQASSPCINLGNNADIALSDDLDGNPRIVGAVVDMGAYECQSPVPLTAAIQVDNTNVATGFPLELHAVVRGGIANFISWNFGDGTASTNQTPISHVWSSPGVYTVTLLASNEYAPGTAGATLAVNVGIPPVVYANASGTNPVPPYLSWNTAATNIQDAIDAAYDGGTVLVTNGAYQFGGQIANGDNLTNRAAITKPIAVQSVNGPLVTAIQGNPSLNNNAVRCVYMASGASLSGFTLLDGSTLNSGYAEQRCGGGIYCESSNVTVSDCILETNTAAYSGGAIFQGSINNCLINNNFGVNSGGGAAYCALTNCSFTANTSGLGGGGGAFECFIVNSSFNTNYATDGGGVAFCTLSSCVLTNNAVNTDGGGAYQSDLTNCLLVANNAGIGGGAYGCTAVNCTVVNNSASDYGGIDSSSSAYNCIVYYNTAFGNNYTPGMTLNYCCTTPMPSGAGNITNAPSFVNITNDFHLQSNSPCINVGNNSYVTSGTDLDGNSRIVDGVVDMGAYEYPAPIPLDLTVQLDSTNVATGFPLHFQAVTGRGSANYVLWDFGDGTTVSNQFSASHVWSAPGTYTLMVTVSNGFVPESTIVTLTINVVASPVSYVNVNGSNPVPPYFSWGTAATNIQDAVNAAYDGGFVVVTNGIYATGGQTVNGFGLTNRVAIYKQITVESVNGPASTLIEGFQVAGSKNGNGAVRCVYLNTNATLIGFTLTNGATLGAGDATNEESGGGILCQSANACVVSNCIITVNCATNLGGGAFQGTLLNCTIANNNSGKVGGGAAAGTLVGCTVLGNQAQNGGGGVANALVVKSLVISNVASLYAGGGVSNCTVFSSAIAANYAGSYGGGAYGGALVNCTVTGNSAGFYGGGTASCATTNSIIYYNKIFSNNSSETNWVAGTPLNYCCTTPSAGGNNITTPPVLADIAHISLNSPCRQAGNPSVTNGVDIDGNPWGNPPSIGCSEIPSTGDYGNLAVNISTAFTNWAPGYPLYFQATISGPDYMTIWNFGDGTIVTNAPYLTHVWSSTSNYPVTLTAFNDSYPTGVTATLMINIALPTNYYVNLANPNPVPPYSYWSIAATNIQDAVGVAAPGSVVMVTNPSVVISPVDQRPYTNTVAVYQYGGAMTPVSNHPFYRVCATNPITIESVNGPATTYIVGQPFGSAGCVYLTNGAALIGFTLTNGSSFNGGGIYAASTNVIITNCVIEQCSSSSGEAVYSGTVFNCLITNSQTGAYESMLNNCALLGNTGYGEKDCQLNNCVISNNASSGAYGGILNNCFIIHNSATDGGGAYGDVGDPIVLNSCVIRNNTAQLGAGAFGTSSRFAILNNCIVVSNTASSAGGGVFQAQLNNCLIISNRVSTGSGGGVDGGLVTNCTVVFNSASSGGGLSSCQAANCILYYNNGGNYSSGASSYCCTFPLPSTGFANFTNAPLFINTNNNFRLQSSSPCINSGNNIYVSTATDLDGNPRIQGGTVDIGAYEYQTPTSIISYAYLQQYGLPTDGSVDFVDLDGSGFTVYQDWIAGLNPTNSASVLVMLPVTTTNTTAGIKVTWQSVNGINYFLQRTTNLPAPFSTIQSNIIGNAGTTTYSDTSATNGTPYFYRVGVQAP